MDDVTSWADLVYSTGGSRAHIRPFAAFAHAGGERATAWVLCGRTPALFEEWHGTGSYDEQGRAEQLPLCTQCAREAERL